MALQQQSFLSSLKRSHLAMLPWTASAFAVLTWPILIVEFTSVKHRRQAQFSFWLIDFVITCLQCLFETFTQHHIFYFKQQRCLHTYANTNQSILRHSAARRNSSNRQSNWEDAFFLSQEGLLHSIKNKAVFPPPKLNSWLVYIYIPHHEIPAAFFWVIFLKRLWFSIKISPWMLEIHVSVRQMYGK